MAGLWFALHGMMVVSGLFYQDWLPESVSLLICYPIVFSVFASRDDNSTFRSILRGAVFAVLPFLAWSSVSVPLSFAYPGYKGVFYDANCLSMCCIVMATAALLLAYASFTEKKIKAALAYLLLGVSGGGYAAGDALPFGSAGVCGRGGDSGCGNDCGHGEAPEAAAGAARLRSSCSAARRA